MCRYSVFKFFFFVVLSMFIFLVKNKCNVDVSLIISKFVVYFLRYIIINLLYVCF